MPYIGNQPAEQFTSFATQEFSTSATTSYTLDHAVTNENEIALFINNVRQQPGSGKAYTATGTALTLSAATASTDTMYCVFLGRALQTVNPATNSISTTMISDNAVTAAKISASLGKIGQVVQTVKTDIFTSTTASFTDVTGFSVAITPTATSSKVLVLAQYNMGVSSGYKSYSTLLRGSTEIYRGDQVGSNRKRSSYSGKANANDDTNTVSHIFLDSPNTTSETTYKIQAFPESGGTLTFNCFNHSASNDVVANSVDAASLTVMEVLA